MAVTCKGRKLEILELRETPEGLEARVKAPNWQWITGYTQAVCGACSRWKMKNEQKI